MNSTDMASATAAGGRQVGQLLAGRYRLGLYKGGDDIADVWHALDESTEKVVTLEILRDRDNDAARQRFLAEAQRMAAIERPSVMRVAAIHNEASDTFIVFEHLIPLPVVLTGLSAIAKDTKPATAAEDTTVVLTPAAPQAPVSPIPSLLSSIPVPDRSTEAPAPETAEAGQPTIVELDTPVTAEAASAATARTGALQEMLATLKGDVSAVVADVRAVLPDDLDTTRISSFVARVSSLVARVSSLVESIRPKSGARPAIARAPRQPRLAQPRARASTDAAPDLVATSGQRANALMATVARTAGPLARRAAANAGPLAQRVAADAGPLLARAASSAAPLFARARHNQIVSAVAIGGIILAVFVVSPLDDAVVGLLRNQSLSLPLPSVAPQGGGLTRAPFEVPPLSAYGAAFETQGPYPTATPGGNVEWVVALRNTGSAGWYRGIEGAQAALALSDGTGVAVQSTPYVAPGQIGWFVVHFRARADVGTYNVPLVPRIDGRGLLQDLGIFAVVTVSKNP